MRKYMSNATEQYAQESIDRAIAQLDWKPFSSLVPVPMSQGMAIQQIIDELHIPKISEFSLYGTIVPLPEICKRQACYCYGLYGIRAHFDNATVRIYIADEGTQIRVVAVDEEEIHG